MILRIITFAVTICFYAIITAECFLSDEYATLDRKLGKSHVELTECALNKVALQVLKDEDMPSATECGVAVEERIRLCQIDGAVCAGFDNAVGQFARSVAAVDDMSRPYDPIDHFDAETFKSANDRIIIGKQAAYAAIQNGPNYDLARQIYGHVIHMVQDFYSHSNWIELGNIVINSHLGHDSAFFENNTAPSHVDTCVSCERIEDYFNYCNRDDPDNCEHVELDNNGCFFIEILSIGHCDPIYRCDDQSQLLLDNKAMLTSGYKTNSNNATKCRHGGGDDFFVNMEPTGGINKDTNCIIYSPRFDLHEKAAQLAEDATHELLLEIRFLLGDDNFNRLIGMQSIARPTSDLAVVVDTTGSMHNDLNIIKSEAKNLATISLADYYVLAPFSDPQVGPVFRTRNVAEFHVHVDKIRPNMYGTGGNDLEEMCFSGVLAAMNVSKVTTPLFVFTDEAPKDKHRFAEVAVLSMEKLYQLNFMITQFNVNVALYKELAKLTNGMVIFSRNQDVSAITRAQIDNLQSDELLLIRQSTAAGATIRYQVRVDDVTELVVEAASVRPNGITRLSVGHVDGDYSFVTNQSHSSTSFKRLGVLKPKPAEWLVNIAADGEYSLRVFTKRRNRVTFRIVLGRLMKRSNTTTQEFLPLHGRPVTGENYAISVEFPNPNPVNFSKVFILAANGDRLATLTPLRQNMKKLMTATFKTPASEFGVLLEGFHSTNKVAFQHLRSGFFRPVHVGIEDKTAPKAQYVKVNDTGKMRFRVTNYGSNGLNVNFLAFDYTGQISVVALPRKTVFIPSQHNVNVEVMFTSKTNVTSPTSTQLYFVATYSEVFFNYFAKEVILLPNENIDSVSPIIVLNEVSPQSPTKCEHVWSGRVTVSDSGSGIAEVSTRPVNGTKLLQTDKTFTSGDHEVSCIFQMSCNMKTVTIFASDLAGNSNLKTVHSP